ncbi:MAG: NAD(P)/FAD-dependent oxidoreductase [Treponema sp.]|nr:NAD(P)/FAD-dependent oxidoreductase [Treponema sp.]
MSELYDVAVIGTGPAGVSAAITLKIRNKKIILFGSASLSEKIEKAHEINNYPGFPAIKGSELQSKLLEHLKQMKIDITEKSITSVYPMGKYFSMISNKNEIFESKTVIIATGVNFGKPYAGESEFLGRGVSYCATCDAPLYKGKSVAVIAASKKEEEEAAFLAEVVQSVTYIPLYKEDVSFADSVSDKIKVIHDVPVSIQGEMKANKLILKNQEIVTDGIFILRDSVAPSQLIQGIQMENNHISVNRKLETNIPGLFACGDIAGTPYQYIKSAGEGNVAALSAVNYLSSLGGNK